MEDLGYWEILRLLGQATPRQGEAGRLDSFCGFERKGGRSGRGSRGVLPKSARAAVPLAIEPPGPVRRDVAVLDVGLGAVLPRWGAKVRYAMVSRMLIIRAQWKLIRLGHGIEQCVSAYSFLVTSISFTPT